MDIGVRPDQDLSRRAYIQYFNFDLLGYLAFAILAIPVVYLLPPEIRLFLHTLCFFYVLVISICFYLNSLGYHVLSSVVINLGLLLAVAIVDTSVGSASQVHLFILSVCITPLFMVQHQKWLAFLMMLLGFVLFILLSEGLLHRGTVPYGSPEIVSFFRRAVTVLVMPVTTMRFIYIFQVNDYYITELEGQRRYLRKIIDLNPNFIFAKNRKGEFTMVNEAVAKTYNTTVGDLLGRTEGEFNPNTVEVERFRSDDLDVMDSREVKFVPIEEITDTITGRKRYLQTVKTPLEDDDGHANQILGVSTDITDRMEIQKKLEQVQEVLRDKNIQLEKYIESNLQLENFAYIASHDLKEPLRSIIGYSQLLERRYADILDSDGREYINHLITSTKSMSSLITDLLLFSRINTESIKYQSIMMEEVIGQVRENLKSAISDSQAEIIWHHIPDTITADRSRIIQLFQNLIGNAIKFQKALERPTINIACVIRDGMYEFTVRDNGIGIEAQYQERIFHIFHRLHTRSEYEGSGIGLATCHKIVEQHGGTIWVQSKPGEGSTFIFTISRDL
jgi:PAS domain S-box-containing protein